MKITDILHESRISPYDYNEYDDEQKEQQRILSILTKECPYAFDTEIFRGTRYWADSVENNNNDVSVEVAYKTKLFYGDSSSFSRKSANTQNYYTVLIDKFLSEWNKFPNRGKSWICSTNKHTADTYNINKLFRVYPVGNPIIGICSLSDMWDSFANYLGGSTLHDFNQGFYFLQKEHSYKITPGDSYSAITKTIEFFDEIFENEINDKINPSKDSIRRYILDQLYVSNKKIDEFIRNKYGFFECLTHILDPEENGFTVCKLSELKSILDEGAGYNKEVWFSGPAYFKSINIKESDFNKK